MAQTTAEKLWTGGKAEGEAMANTDQTSYSFNRITALDRLHDGQLVQ